MNRKVSALILAASMTAALAVPGFADETAAEDTTEASDYEFTFSYDEDIDPEVYDGVWFSTGLGFDLYLPGDWKALDVTEIDGAEDAGIVFMFQSPEEVEEGVMGTAAVSANEVTGIEDLNTIYDELDRTGDYDYLHYCLINEIPCVYFQSSKLNADGVAFASNDILYTVTIAPDDCEDFDPYITNIIASLRFTEDESVSEESTEAE